MKRLLLAVAANADAMRRVINALRQAGAREIATQWVSVYPYTRAEDGTVEGFSASNSISAVGDVDDAAARSVVSRQSLTRQLRETVIGVRLISGIRSDEMLGQFRGIRRLLLISGRVDCR